MLPGKKRSLPGINYPAVQLTTNMHNLKIQLTTYTTICIWQILSSCYCKQWVKQNNCIVAVTLYYQKPLFLTN